jgi:hypothetical protein
MVIASRFNLLLLGILCSTVQIVGQETESAGQSAGQNLDTRIPNYVDLSLDELINQIPDLKGLQPAEDQKQLSVILERTGASVGSFIDNVGDLIANEDVTQQRLDADGKIKAKERVKDDYLILHHGTEWGVSAEYRNFGTTGRSTRWTTSSAVRSRISECSTPMPEESFSTSFVRGAALFRI